MTLPVSGYVAAGGLLLSVVAGFAGYAHGVSTGRDREVLRAQEQLDKTNAERDRLRGTIEKQAIDHLTGDQQRHDSNREIRRESTLVVERPLYRVQCVDADGVRLLDRAAALANGQPDPGVSAGSAARASAGAAISTGNDRGAVSRQSD